MAKKMQYLR